MTNKDQLVCEHGIGQWQIDLSGGSYICHCDPEQNKGGKTKWLIIKFHSINIAIQWECLVYDIVWYDILKWFSICTQLIELRFKNIPKTFHIGCGNVILSSYLLKFWKYLKNII